MEVVIWGAANWGGKALEICNLLQIEVKAFLDRNTSIQGTLYKDTHIRIIAPDEYKDIAAYDNLSIIMATNDRDACNRALHMSKNIITYEQLQNAWMRLGRKDYPKVQLRNENIENCKLIDTRENMLKMFPTGMVMAEIGSFKGDFAERILEICKPLKLYLIDSWEGERWEQYYQQVRERFKKEIEVGQVEIRKGNSIDILNGVNDAELDWVFIDTVHDYITTRAELELSHGKVKPSGYICGHDYTHYNVGSRVEYGVWSAVNEFAVNFHYEMKYMTMEYHGCKSFCLKRLESECKPLSLENTQSK